MSNLQNNNPLSPRENFLMGLLNKVIKEYKNLVEMTRKSKPYKIVNILELSSVPGDTKFAIQISYKNTVIALTAADIVSQSTTYNLNDFSDYHADMIRYAAQGKLSEFFKFSQQKNTLSIVSKSVEKTTQQYLFVIKTPTDELIKRTANEIAADKALLHNLTFDDIYDVAYTNGSESIIKEKIAIALAKNK